MYYTYCYLNEEGQPYYVGKGSGDRAYNPNHSVSLPPRDRILILKDELTEEEAFRHEVYMIEILGRKNQGSGILENMTKGGKQPPTFMSHSEKTKSKMKERRHSAETKRKIGEASKARMNEEEKQRLSNLWKGRLLTQETKDKLSKSLTGIKRSEETKQKMREAAKKRWEKRKSGS